MSALLRLYPFLLKHSMNAHISCIPQPTFLKDLGLSRKY